MRKTSTIGLDYVVGFICEGTKSEPYFLEQAGQDAARIFANGNCEEGTGSGGGWQEH